ncbi:hypothetical protein BZG36_04561 [Bifiguratus adelaidae]|uniref:Protein kinase domain-containing protein n=1 Tax=Bifiguratus adelaidae TaxID=1938954 RepID=A0A261XXH4_9FUNG|nr:hypothetical protein BZG36_04561 [Bifiguratus adelaidae]
MVAFDGEDDVSNAFAQSFLDTVVDDDLKVLEVLGQGSYGCLFLAQSITDNTYYAIKTLSKLGLDETQLALQKAEIEIHQSVYHPNIVTLHRVIEDASVMHIVMELCESDLFDHIMRDQKVSNIRDGTFLRTAFRQVLDAVDYLHVNDVYHRDIKPENVLLQYADTELKTEMTFKLADFGLATKDAYSTEYGCGSTSYLAPEHFANDGDSLSDEDDSVIPYSCAASDVWSLGILLMAILFGRNPWKEASTCDPVFKEFTRQPRVLKQLFPISEECYQFLTGCLALDPEKRKSVAQLKADFDKIRYFTTVESRDDDAEAVKDVKTINHDQVHHLGTTAPMDIPSAQIPRARFPLNDSAICVSSGSWSDMASLDESGCADLNFEGDPFAVDIGSFVNKFDSSLFKPASDSTSVTSSSLETLDDFSLSRNMDNFLAKKMEHARIEDANDHEPLFVHADEQDSWWL